MSLNIFTDLVIQAKLAIEQTNNIADLKTVHVKFLGKRGYINQHIQKLHHISSNIRPKLGLAINQAKKDIHTLLIKRQNTLVLQTINHTITNQSLDVTLPGRLPNKIGSLHPITNTIERMTDFFKSLGFTVVHGPEIESDYFNFSALNIPEHHPARNEHDTFWINNKYLLRTHTSGIQIRIMKQEAPPIRIISYGRVYRKDYDNHHTPMFHQMEGLMIDTNINFNHLKQILFNFLYFLFTKDIILRFRPSHFPFTEPSAEIDAIINKQANHWVELLGCGMVHPNILHRSGINTKKFSGFAFGIGIERLTMLLYQIYDIRLFFKNDLNFLNQFT